MNKRQYTMFGAVLCVLFILDLLWAWLSGNWNRPYSIQEIILMLIVLSIPVSLMFYKGGI